MKHYIYRYNNGISVIPSRSSSEQETWNFAIQCLRPAVVKDDKEAERIVREIGTVVEDDDE